MEKSLPGRNRRSRRNAEGTDEEKQVRTLGDVDPVGETKWKIRISITTGPGEITVLPRISPHGPASIPGSHPRRSTESDALPYQATEPLHTSRISAIRRWGALVSPPTEFQKRTSIFACGAGGALHLWRDLLPPAYTPAGSGETRTRATEHACTQTGGETAREREGERRDRT